MTPDAAIVERIEQIFREMLSIEIPSADAELIDSGIIDSLALVELLSAIEQEFAIQVPLDGLELDDFRTAKRVALFVQRAPNGRVAAA
jgi:acyl carrier protein